MIATKKFSIFSAEKFEILKLFIPKNAQETPNTIFPIVKLIFTTEVKHI